MLKLHKEIKMMIRAKIMKAHNNKRNRRAMTTMTMMMKKTKKRMKSDFNTERMWIEKESISFIPQSLFDHIIVHSYHKFINNNHHHHNNINNNHF